MEGDKITLAEYRKRKEKEIATKDDVLLLNDLFYSVCPEHIMDIDLDSLLEREATDDEKLLLLLHRQRVQLKELAETVYSMRDKTVEELIEAVNEKGLAFDLYVASISYNIIDMYVDLLEKGYTFRYSSREVRDFIKRAGEDE